MKTKIMTLVVVIVLIGGVWGCKKGDIADVSGEVTGIWRTVVSYDPSSGLNLPWVFLITLHAGGGLDLFGKPGGTFSVDEGRVRFGFAYEDKYRSTTHQFRFLCTIPTSGRMTGVLQDDGRRIGTVAAARVAALDLFDVVGNWSFRVDFHAGSEAYRGNLPREWNFTFTATEEVWLGNQRKQTYVFDGLNIRFLCHYYLDESTGSAKHLLFTGTMSDDDHLSGYLYNDVGDAMILGDFIARRD
ncbi:MAG TPA: hypothetical protein ENN40_06375 [Candidatus Aminicenantes bacterium]|nr:hypothetical protein [Candidatus Aminicenantes bacterium]